MNDEALYIPILTLFSVPSVMTLVVFVDIILLAPCTIIMNASQKQHTSLYYDHFSTSERRETGSNETSWNFKSVF